MNVGDYSAVYVTLETDGPLAGYGLTFTNGHGTEIGVAAANALARLVVGRDARGDHRRHARLLPPPHPGPAAALDRAREGHRPHGHGRGRQRDLGPVGPARGQAGLEAAGRPDAAADRRLRAVPLDQRRAHAGRGARASSSATRRRGPRARPRCAATASRPTRPPRAGSATPTRRCGACAARRWPRAARTSR